MEAQRILVVDDYFPSRIIMEKLLQRDGYETVSCGSGEYAVRKLKEGFFGILITDLQMGGMDGLELIKEARRIYPEISTILVTGLSNLETELTAKREGVNGFSPKPIDWDGLIGFLNTLKRGKRVQI